nr:hypothetical protein [Tanacetum cinerariifolium]
PETRRIAEQGPHRERPGAASGAVLRSPAPARRGRADQLPVLRSAHHRHAQQPDRFRAEPRWPDPPEQPGDHAARVQATGDPRARSAGVDHRAADRHSHRGDFGGAQRHRDGLRGQRVCL